MVKRFKYLIFFLHLIFLSVCLPAQNIAPQVWNNVYVGWDINDQFSLRNAAAYNVLVSSEYPWSEVTLNSTGIYKFHRFFEASAG